MSDLVPAEDIERIVGISRHPSMHYGRAISTEQVTYVLHSQECKNATPDLRDCIFSLALEGLGALTSRGSGLLCMAIVGGAIVPLLQALVADHVGLLVSFAVPLVCYVYIAHYGAAGHRPVAVESAERPPAGAALGAAA